MFFFRFRPVSVTTVLSSWPLKNTRETLPSQILYIHLSEGRLGTRHSSTVPNKRLGRDVRTRTVWIRGHKASNFPQIKDISGTSNYPNSVHPTSPLFCNKDQKTEGKDGRCGEERGTGREHSTYLIFYNRHWNTPPFLLSKDKGRDRTEGSVVTGELLQDFHFHRPC